VRFTALPLERVRVFVGVLRSAPTMLRKADFSMAALWLALAGQDEAIDNLLASWDMARARQN
jgi:hypothetical protein